MQKIENPSTTINHGKGYFVFSDYAPLSDKPIEVYYYAPEKEFSELKVVIVMHGHKRNGNDYRDSWIKLAEKYDLLIIAPVFSNEDFPDAMMYNLGNLVGEDGNFIEKQKWTFKIIDSLFDKVREMTINVHSTYYLFGHSAGAQFVHRFMIYNPNNNVETAIAANAGWYTLPNFKINFPYGLDKSPLTKLDKDVFQKELVILLGENDNDSDSPNLRRNDDVDVQGTNRFSRGEYFYKQSKKRAEQLNFDFNWKIDYVKNVGHDGALMSEAGAVYLFGE